jgi:SOS-response transcriptional repressor LexA
MSGMRPHRLTTVERERGVARRERIMAFVAQFEETHGHSPTVREITRAVGLVSSATTHEHLLRLEREGRLARRQVSTGRFMYTARVDGEA